MKDSITKTLLNADNTTPVTLFDERGKRIDFEQLAVIPLGESGENRLYAVLSPVSDTAYIKRSEAIVVRCEDDRLVVETDGKLAAAVYDRYVALVVNRNRVTGSSA